jgi:hypothetical protein
VGEYHYGGTIYHAMAWDVHGAVALDLNDRLPAGSDADGWELFKAWSINDAGQIAGFGTHYLDRVALQRGFRLTPSG